jgi:hypothetical protein
MLTCTCVGRAGERQPVRVEREDTAGGPGLAPRHRPQPLALGGGK